MIGRQNPQCALSSQQLMAASAAVRYIIAKKREFSAVPREWSADSCRKTRLHIAGACSAQKRAMSVWSAVRVVEFSEPIDLTSANSRV